MDPRRDVAKKGGEAVMVDLEVKNPPVAVVKEVDGGDGGAVVMGLEENPPVEVAVAAMDEGGGGHGDAVEVGLEKPPVEVAVVVAAEPAMAEDAVPEEAAVDLAVPEEAAVDLAVPVPTVAVPGLPEHAVGNQEADSSEGQQSKKRKMIFEVVVELSDDELEEEGSPYSFNSEDSCESMDARNMASFTQKEVLKLQANARGPYVKNNRYQCPYHTTKPKSGLLPDLLQHVRELAYSSKGRQERAEHAALLEVLLQAGLA